MGCVQTYAVNPLNFLRWHPAAAVVLPFPVPLDYCQPLGLPCSLFLDSSLDEGYPTLPVVAGDTLRFFINSDAGIDITKGFASVGLGLVQNGVLVTPNAGTLDNIPDPDNATGFYLYGSLAIDCQPDGLYWPVIYDLADKHVLLIANPVEVVNRQNWQRETVWVKYRHPKNLYGVMYADLPGFYQEFRLALSMFQPKFSTDEDTYTDRNNYTRTTRLAISRVYELQTDFWDEAMFTAACLMLTHKGELFIADKLVAAQGGLDPEYFDGSPWVAAKGKVLDLNFSRTVLAC